MRWHDLLDATEVLEVVHDAGITVSDVTHDSRAVHPGALFCCITGVRADGHDFASAAVGAGAAALLVERVLDARLPQARVASVRRALGPVAARFHGDPSRHVPVVGVTGTNGKTTTTYVLRSIMEAEGRNAAIVGTLGAGFGDDMSPQSFTTPEATELQRTLAQLRARGADAIAMEVSSHALAEHRVDGSHFAAVCFTNLGRDHLDLHGSVESYLAAKARLFTPEFSDRAAINVDDRRGRALASQAVRLGLDVLTFAVDSDDADVRFEVTGVDGRGSAGRIEHHGGAVDVRVPLAGRFNVANALAAATTARHLGIEWAAIARGLAAAPSVPGRFERIGDGRAAVTVVVDYAHTPDGITNALAAARGIGGGRVIAVFGCGGDRDPSKRADMGAAAGRGADLVVLTNDNPRTEEPAAIATMAARGLEAVGADYRVELDRQLAIETAVGAARPGDVVMVLGKGAETGQQIGGELVPFDDRAVAAAALEATWS